jgi:hypothetical protein
MGCFFRLPAPRMLWRAARRVPVKETWVQSSDRFASAESDRRPIGCPGKPTGSAKKRVVADRDIYCTADGLKFNFLQEIPFAGRRIEACPMGGPGWLRERVSGGSEVPSRTGWLVCGILKDLRGGGELADVLALLPRPIGQPPRPMGDMTTVDHSRKTSDSGIDGRG